MRRREITGLLLLALPTGALGLFAWLTAHPRSAVLDRVAAWEAGRPWVERFRDRFDPPSPENTAPDGLSPTRAEVVVVTVGEARPRVWVEPGLVARVAPEPVAEAVAVVDVIANVVYSEKRGGWYRLEHPGRGHDGAWVYLPDGGQPRPASGLEPVRPLRAARPDAEVVAAARALMTAGARQEICGPYVLVTDVPGESLVAACARLAAALDDEYRATFGVEPIGDPEGTIFVFAERPSYRAFVTGRGVVRAGYAGFAKAARGYVALTAEGLSRDEVLKILVHELTHLTTRRAVGPALPRWLSEGISDVVGDRAREDGFAPAASITDSAGEARRLRAAYDGGEAGSLERLLSLDGGDFDSDVPSFDYEQSAFFVRFLLETEATRDPFRGALAGLAAGEPYDPEALLAALGAGTPSLDRDFELWLRRRWLAERVETVPLRPQR